MEILNTYSVYDSILNVLPLIPLLGFAYFGIKAIVKLLVKEWKNALISLLIAVICFGAFYGLVELWESSETNRYEVLVTDYNKIDFNKYKIIENRGKIVVLEEIK
jgi:hypothetical protein